MKWARVCKEPQHANKLHEYKQLVPENEKVYAEIFKPPPHKDQLQAICAACTESYLCGLHCNLCGKAFPYHVLAASLLTSWSSYELLELLGNNLSSSTTNGGLPKSGSVLVKQSPPHHPSSQLFLFHSHSRLSGAAVYQHPRRPMKQWLSIAALADERST